MLHQLYILYLCILCLPKLGLSERWASDFHLSYASDRKIIDFAAMLNSVIQRPRLI